MAFRKVHLQKYRIKDREKPSFSAFRCKIKNEGIASFTTAFKFSLLALLVFLPDKPDVA